MGAGHDSGRLKTRRCDQGPLPFQVVLRSNCTLSKRLPHDHSIDAKSVFDALIKECAGSRQDRRTAVDLAIVRETLKAQGSRIRWIPHPLMPLDSMTKMDPSAGNDALRHLLRTGKLLWDEETIRQSAGLGRSETVSRRQLATNEETVYPGGTVNGSWGHSSALMLQVAPSLCCVDCVTSSFFGSRLALQVEGNAVEKGEVMSCPGLVFDPSTAASPVTSPMLRNINQN